MGDLLPVALALDVDLCRRVRRAFMRAVFRFYTRKAQADSIEHGRTGGVNQMQRSGSALNANTPQRCMTACACP